MGSHTGTRLKRSLLILPAVLLGIVTTAGADSPSTNISFSINPDCRVEPQTDIGIRALVVLESVRKSVCEVDSPPCKKGSEAISRGKQLLQITCLKGEKTCSGLQIDLESKYFIAGQLVREHREPLTWIDARTLSFDLVSVVGKIATLRMRESIFTVDAGMGMVIARRSFAGDEEVGRGTCRAIS